MILSMREKVRCVKVVRSLWCITHHNRVTTFPLIDRIMVNHQQHTMVLRDVCCSTSRQCSGFVYICLFSFRLIYATYCCICSSSEVYLNPAISKNRIDLRPTEVSGTWFILLCAPYNLVTTHGSGRIIAGL